MGTVPSARRKRRIRRVLVVASGHGWSTTDVYTGLGAGLRDLGVHAVAYDLRERIGAAESWLQMARERWGKPDDPEVTPEDVLYQSGKAALILALEHDADAVIVVCGLLFDPRLYILLQRAHIPTFVYGTESPYDDDMFSWILPLVTAASTNERTSVSRLAGTENAAPLTYLPVGYNPAVHYPGAGKDLRVPMEYGGVATGEVPLPQHDVVFVGNVFPSRAETLEAINWTDVDFGLYGVFKMLPEDSPLWQYKRGEVVPNVVATGLHTNAKIVLNLFRVERLRDEWRDVTRIEGAESISPRLIECAACGNFVISEYRPEVAEIFGDAVPTFTTPVEAEELIRHYLAHPDERERLAARLPALVASYRYQDRAASIIDILERV